MLDMKTHMAKHTRAAGYTVAALALVAVLIEVLGAL
jgi:hypothetical protein